MKIVTEEQHVSVYVLPIVFLPQLLSISHLVSIQRAICTDLIVKSLHSPSARCFKTFYAVPSYTAH